MEDRNLPTTLLPNPGEGGPVASGDEAGIPVVPLPNPGEGGPVESGSEAGVPVIPLPNPGEGGAVYPGTGGSVAVMPLPGSGGLIPVTPQRATVRFLNAAYGYPPFRIFVGGTRVVNLLSSGSISAYSRYPVGYQTVTVAGQNGYIYLQKSLPFEAGSISTIAVVNRAGGLDLTRITDACCAPSGSYANFRVSNLAYNSDPMDVLLADGRVVYADVRFKETTDYKRIVPGAYQFLFAPTNLLPMPAYADIETLDSAFIGMMPYAETAASIYLNIRAGGNYTVFLMNNGPATNAISAFAIEDR